MLTHGHAKSDRRNLMVHRAALDKLRQHPELRKPVLDLLERWLAQETAARAWLEQWREMLLTWPFERMRQLILDEEAGQILRQCSPLGPVLTPRERWQALETAASLTGSSS